MCRGQNQYGCCIGKKVYWSDLYLLINIVLNITCNGVVGRGGGEGGWLFRETHFNLFLTERKTKKIIDNN